MITLASKRENEEAFWTGLTNGFGPPGFTIESFFWTDEPWYQEDLSLSGTTVPGQNTDLQYSYNLGYASSVVGFSTFMFGVGTYAGATAGFATTVGVNLVYVAAQFGNAMIPYLRAGARSIPLLGLFYLLLQFGNVADYDRVNLDERREHMQ